MKILITTPIFPPEIGGPATYTLEVSRRLKACGHTVRIVTFADAAPDVPDLDVAAIRNRTVVPGSVSRQSRLFAALLRASRGMDLVYAQGPVVVGLGSIAAGKLTGKPVVVKFVGDVAWEGATSRGETVKSLDDFLRQPEGGWQTALTRRIESFVLRHADRIITPSLYLKHVLAKFYGIPDSGIEVVYNAVAPDAFAPVADSNAGYGRPLLTTVGRLVPWKGVDELIEMVPVLVKKYPRVKLQVIGEGPEESRLKHLCRKLGVETHVVFAGKLEHKETIARVSSSDLFILNSRYEGLPHVVLEAMACGCPVVATDIAGTREALGDGSYSAAFTPGNREEMEEKITRLLEDCKARKEMAEQAYRNVISRFTWEKTLDRLESVLGSVLS